MTVVAFIGLWVIYSSFVSLYPYKTLVVNEAKAVTETVKAGDLFMYSVDYCKYTDKPATVYRTFHSIDESQLIPFPAVSTITVAGCNVAKIPLQTFVTIPPGQYYLLVDAVFQMNSQREIHVVFKTNEFTVQ